MVHIRLPLTPGILIKSRIMLRAVSWFAGRCYGTQFERTESRLML